MDEEIDLDDTLESFIAAFGEVMKQAEAAGKVDVLIALTRKTHGHFFEGEALAQARETLASKPALLVRFEGVKNLLGTSNTA